MDYTAIKPYCFNRLGSQKAKQICSIISISLPASTPLVTRSAFAQACTNACHCFKLPRESAFK